MSGVVNVGVVNVVQSSQIWVKVVLKLCESCDKIVSSLHQFVSNLCQNRFKIV